MLQTTVYGWFGLEEALDRTLSATGLRTVCRKVMQNIGGQLNSNDVVTEVFLRRVNVSAVPLLKTGYPQLESDFKRSNVQFCVKECARGVRDRALQRASRICRYLLCSSLLSAIVEIKSLLVAYGVPYAFLDLHRDSHSFEKNANTLGKSNAHQNFVLDCVNFASLGDIRLRSGTVWRKRLWDEDL